MYDKQNETSDFLPARKTSDEDDALRFAAASLESEDQESLGGRYGRIVTLVGPKLKSNPSDVDSGSGDASATFPAGAAPEYRGIAAFITQPEGFLEKYFRGRSAHEIQKLFQQHCVGVDPAHPYGNKSCAVIAAKHADGSIEIVDFFRWDSKEERWWSEADDGS